MKFVPGGGHSVRNDLTGLAIAALIAWKPTVSSAIAMADAPAATVAEADWTPEAIAAHFTEISDMGKAKALENAFQQTHKYVGQAAARAGVKL